MKIKLYKIINDELIRQDYGVLSQVDSYEKQGFIVFIARTETEDKMISNCMEG